MNAARPPPTLSALLARLVLGWLLALQPMVLGFAAAGATGLQHLPICRGAPEQAADLPGSGPVDHAACCLGGCLPVGAGPASEPAALPSPQTQQAVVTASTPADADATRAGLGPQRARAPPAHLIL
jgi:hypothetical protein